ncbi:MAG TPA: FadD3 family acyl-CoA ligase [Acidimicrobiales bacterium]|nr:FadD3 family acyl-CoA ligase [Acidimicrobiales bacterium]
MVDAPTIPALVVRAAEHFGPQEALVDREGAGGDDLSERRLSFAELAAATDQAARAYVAHGLEPGDRVAIWAPNSAGWVIAALGAYRAGGVVTTVNTRFKGPEAAHVIRTAGARLLVTVTDFLDTDYVALLAGAGSPDCLALTLVLRGPVREGCLGWDNFLARATEADPAAVAARARAIAPDDVSTVIFTSGTTGAPKGAMLRHGPSVRAFAAWSDVVGLEEGDRYLVVNPFFHTFGLKAGILACLVKGATIVPHATFDVTSVMRRVEEERITMLPGAPAIYQTILDHPELDRFDLSSLRLAVTGAATVPVEMIRRMASELTFTKIVTGYGLTESTGVVTMCRHTDDPETIANTAGRPLPDVEVRTVDEAGKDVPPGQPGEVLVRGYNVMAGYIGDPEATAATIDADGWLHTGDIGVLDGNGNLKITDRLKDMFIVGGFNAYPAEIENMIMEHPAVGQVAVVGVTDQRLGEVAKAFVVPRTGATIDEAGLIAWCRDRMANYKVPRSVQVVDALPLNASGKVLKYVLREQAGTSPRGGGPC